MRKVLVGFALAVLSVLAVASSQGSSAAEHPELSAGFYLIDADTDKVITKIKNGALFYLDELPNPSALNIAIILTEDSSGPLTVYLNKEQLQFATNPPYALFGITGSGYQGRALAVGSWEIMVIPDVGYAFDVHFDIKRSRP